MSQAYIEDSDEDGVLLDGSRLSGSDDASFRDDKAEQPIGKSTFPSSITQFPSTSIHATQDHFESPIEQFSISNKSSFSRKGVTKERRRTAVSVEPEIIDLSDNSGEQGYLEEVKGSKTKEEDSNRPEKRKKKKKKDTKRRESLLSPGRHDESDDGGVDIELSAQQLENITISDDEILLKMAKKEKKRSKKRKDGTEKDPSAPRKSKKRKTSEDIDIEEPPLKSRKRRKVVTASPVAGDNDREEASYGKGFEPLGNDESQKGRTRDEQNEAPDSPPRAEEPPPDDRDVSAVPEITSKPTKENVTKEKPRPKEGPRQSLDSSSANQHQIPKRGSISNLLKKTGLHAPLSSSKLVRSTSNRIAPLHLSRRTPPPPPPPISKPKKKVVEDEEDEPDFTGMTKKQIDKYWEEKKNRAWYSP
ncbi:hypothetical protein FRC16_005434 [Serendipita sp. 398]|nr:hypothetical protein FRC16_005434 [Serendipita sp. 398]